MHQGHVYHSDQRTFGTTAMRSKKPLEHQEAPIYVGEFNYTDLINENHYPINETPIIMKYSENYNSE